MKDVTLHTWGIAVGLALVVLATGCATKKDYSKFEFNVEELITLGDQKLRKGNYEEAREAFKRIQEKDVEKNFGAISQLRIGDTYYAEELYDEAIAEYKKFLEIYPYNRGAGYAQFQIAMSHYRRVNGVDRNHGQIRLANKAFEDLVQRYPRSPYVELAQEKARECRRMLIEYEFYVGNFYFKTGAYQSAAGRYEGILKAYPQSPLEADVLFSLARTYKEMKEREKAVAYLERFLSQYPQHKSRPQAEKLLASLKG
ncbi:MAG: outer membrane protein assembly factor BamD [Nitrospirae bacterium]|nr:outer membrane protein assembly factor BamD [Nitrospirota bacterium]